MRESFDSIDLDNDGLINVEEVLKLTQSIEETLSSSEIKQMIDQIDINKDGKVDFTEFCELTEGYFKYQYENQE